MTYKELDQILIEFNGVHQETKKGFEARQIFFDLAVSVEREFADDVDLLRAARELLVVNSSDRKCAVLREKVSEILDSLIGIPNSNRRDARLRLVWVSLRELEVSMDEILLATELSADAGISADDAYRILRRHLSI